MKTETKMKDEKVVMIVNYIVEVEDFSVSNYYNKVLPCKTLGMLACRLSSLCMFVLCSSSVMVLCSGPSGYSDVLTVIYSTRYLE